MTNKQSNVIEVLPPSWMSLYVEIFFNEISLGTGTGFCVEYSNNYYFITNRHVVRGRHNITNITLNKYAAIPNIMHVKFNKRGELGSWISTKFQLYQDETNEESHLWFEHPIHHGNVDVVVFKIPSSAEIDYYPYNFESDFDIKTQPSDYLSVVGFPFSKSSHGYLGIWCTGFMATDFQVDFDDLPLFLIDCRARSGMSGSPVIICRNSGTYISEQGDTKMHTGTRYKLLGVYSGRMNEESDLGYVWKNEAIKDIILNIPPT